MQIRNQWNKEQVSAYINSLQVNVPIDADYVYDVYDMANELISMLDKENSQIEVKEVNQFDLLLYCLGEYYYSVSKLKPSKI